jgi:hypothetical protein
VSRLPIRLRLTAAFAAAMVAVLAGACLFVFLHLRSDLNEAITGGLETRLDAAARIVESRGALGRSDSAVLTEVDESFAQQLAPEGRVVAAIGAVRTPALGESELRRAARERVLTEHDLPGLDDTARVLARPARARGRQVVLAVG